MTSSITLNITSDRYKVLEYMDHSIIKPKSTYDFCLFFFAGFNENSAKYIYPLKSLIEPLPFNIKVIIPMLPVYTLPENEQTKKIIKKRKGNKLYAWYEFKVKEKENKVSIVFNEENDKKIIEMVKKEIEILKDSKRIIFTGFSMGGSYSMLLLDKMKINNLFTFVCKTVIRSYKCHSFGKNDEESKKFRKNKFFVYFSFNDKVVYFDASLRTIRTLKENFEDVHVKFDKGNKHIFDENNYKHLRRLLIEHIIGRGNDGGIVNCGDGVYGSSSSSAIVCMKSKF